MVRYDHYEINPYNYTWQSSLTFTIIVHDYQVTMGGVICIYYTINGTIITMALAGYLHA